MEKTIPKPLREVEEIRDFIQKCMTTYGIDKVEPYTYFITAGQDEKNSWVVAVSRPVFASEVPLTEEKYVPVLEIRTKFSTKEQALDRLSKALPTFPVLVGDDGFFYPNFTDYDRKRRILQKAQERRDRKGILKGTLNPKEPYGIAVKNSGRVKYHKAPYIKKAITWVDEKAEKVMKYEGPYKKEDNTE